MPGALPTIKDCRSGPYIPRKDKLHFKLPIGTPFGKTRLYPLTLLRTGFVLEHPALENGSS
jgi:hypothetical protein